MGFYDAQDRQDKKTKAEALRRLIPFMKALIAYLKKEGHTVETGPINVNWDFADRGLVTGVTKLNGVKVSEGYHVLLRRGEGYRSSLLPMMRIRIDDPADWTRNRRLRTKTFREPKTGFIPATIGKALLDYVQWDKNWRKESRQKKIRENKTDSIYKAAEKIRDKLKLDAFLLIYPSTPEQVSVRIYLTLDEFEKLAKAYKALKRDGSKAS